MKVEELIPAIIDYACTLAIDETRINCEKVQKMNVQEYEQFIQKTIEKIKQEIKKIESKTPLE